MNPQPFFVLGAPQSGAATLLQALAQHSKIAAPPEPHLSASLAHSQWRQFQHWNCAEKNGREKLAQPSYRLQPGPVAREYFFRIAKAHADEIGKVKVSHLGEHSLGGERQLSFILRSFPDAKFVLIYRDGRDAALNMNRPSSRHDSVYMNFLRWAQYYRTHRRLLQREPHRVTCVRYEDFVDNPAEELSVVLEFLGLGYEPQVLPIGVKQDVSSMSEESRDDGLRGRGNPNVGVYRNELSPHMIACLEHWGGWALRDLCYECDTDVKQSLPLWRMPLIYSHFVVATAVLALQRRIDDLFGTRLSLPGGGGVASDVRFPVAGPTAVSIVQHGRPSVDNLL